MNFLKKIASGLTESIHPLRHMVGADEIRQRDISRIADQVAEIIIDYQKTRQFRLVHFGISGYDNDQRAVFDIPEVKTWAKALEARVPYILAVTDTATIGWLLPCIVEVEILGRSRTQTTWRIPPATQEGFMDQAFTFSDRFFVHLAPTKEECDRLREAQLKRVMSVISA